MLTQTLYSENETVLFGKKIAKNLRPGVFIALKGALGAGKTCLCRGILSGLGHTGHVKSPTYPLVEIYSLGSSTIYHFDFYRLDDPLEALDIGIEEYFYSGNYCLLEWAEKIGQFLPDHSFLIDLAIASETGRTLTLHHHQNGN